MAFARPWPAHAAAVPPSALAQLALPSKTDFRGPPVRRRVVCGKTGKDCDLDSLNVCDIRTGGETIVLPQLRLP